MSNTKIQKRILIPQGGMRQVRGLIATKHSVLFAGEADEQSCSWMKVMKIIGAVPSLQSICVLNG